MEYGNKNKSDYSLKYFHINTTLNYNTGIAVSYTHLDVYKRQGQISALLR